MSYLEDPELRGPIQRLARDCDILFQEACRNDSIHSEGISSPVDGYHEAFTSWTSFLYVFAAANSCLDYRLRKHRSVTDIIIRLLEILRQNVYICMWTRKKGLLAPLFRLHWLISSHSVNPGEVTKLDRDGTS